MSIKHVNILVVDSDEEWRKNIAAELRRLNQEVTVFEAEGVASAEKITSEHKIQAAIITLGKEKDQHSAEGVHFMENHTDIKCEVVSDDTRFTSMLFNNYQGVIKDYCRRTEVNNGKPNTNRILSGASVVIELAR